MIYTRWHTLLPMFSIKLWSALVAFNFPPHIQAATHGEAAPVPPATATEKALYLEKLVAQSLEATAGATSSGQAPDTFPKAFQETYGDLQQAQVVLFFYTSLACYFCRKVHLEVIPRLWQSNLPHFAMVVRDYPADLYSLWAAALAWTLPEKTSAMKKVFFARGEGAPDSWVTPIPQKTQKELQALATSFCHSDKEKKLMEQAINHKPLLQKIFDQRTADKKVLAMVEVPKAYVLIRGATPKFLEIEDPTDSQKLLEILKPLCASSVTAPASSRP